MCQNEEMGKTYSLAAFFLYNNSTILSALFLGFLMLPEVTSLFQYIVRSRGLENLHRPSGHDDIPNVLTVFSPLSSLNFTYFPTSTSLLSFTILQSNTPLRSALSAARPPARAGWFNAQYTQRGRRAQPAHHSQDYTTFPFTTVVQIYATFMLTFLNMALKSCLESGKAQH